MHIYSKPVDSIFIYQTQRRGCKTLSLLLYHLENTTLGQKRKESSVLLFQSIEKVLNSVDYLDYLCPLGPQSPCERTDLRMAIVADHLGLSWTGKEIVLPGPSTICLHGSLSSAFPSLKKTT
jgi:hypothetical protein